MQRLLSQISKPFLKKFMGAILTQGLLSGTSLIIKIYIARQAIKSEYGIFVVGFSTILIFNSVQSALVNSPLTVILPEKTGQERHEFISGLGLGQWLFLIPLVLFIAIGILTYSAIQGDVHDFMWMLPLVGVILASLLREFTRVVNYANLLIGKILLGDIIFVACALAGMFFLGQNKLIGGINAIVVLGIAYFFSAVFSYIISRHRYNFRLDWIKRSFGETWKLSRWALVGIAGYNLRTRGYIYIISLVLGLVSTADVDAARLLLMPFILLIFSSQRIFLAKGAQIRNESITKYKNFVIMFILFFNLAWIVYVGLLYLFNDNIIKLVFTDKYLNISKYVVYFAFLSLLHIYSVIFNLSLQVFKEFKMLACFGCSNAVITLLLCLFLTKKMGIEGSLISLMVGEVVMIILSFIRFYSVYRAIKNKEITN